MSLRKAVKGLMATGILTYSLLLLGMGGEGRSSCEAGADEDEAWCCRCPELGQNCEKTSPSGVVSCDGFFCDTTPCWAWET